MLFRSPDCPNCTNSPDGPNGPRGPGGPKVPDGPGDIQAPGRLLAALTGAVRNLSVLPGGMNNLLMLLYNIIISLFFSRL